MDDGRSEAGALDWQEQYAEDRRRATEQTMWQLPGASIAAQAFLYTGGLDPGTTGLGRLLVSVVGLVTAVATALILAVQAYRLQTWRLSLQQLRKKRGVPSLSRSDAVPIAKQVNDAEYDRLERFQILDDPAYAWLAVLAAFATVDVVVLLASIVQLFGGRHIF